MCGIIVNERDYRRELDESNLKLDSSSWYYEVDPVRTRAGQRRPWLQPRCENFVTHSTEHPGHSLLTGVR